MGKLFVLLSSVKGALITMDDSQKLRSELDAIIRVSKRTGVEFCTARELMPRLGYETWENFVSIIEKAVKACEQSGLPPLDHFREATKMVRIGSGAMRSVTDYFLTKHGAHLVAMNGDPSKPEIAFAQTYFSAQTLRQEEYEQMADEDRRIELRDRVKTNFKKLSTTAVESGVTKPKMAHFHGVGYQGLYGGKTKAEILAAKELPASEDLMDRAGSTELAANDFRMTQTRDLLEKKGRIGEVEAIKVHHRIGKEVREAISKIGGTMPEDLPAEPSLKRIESARRKRQRLAPKTPPSVES